MLVDSIKLRIKKIFFKKYLTYWNLAIFLFSLSVQVFFWAVMHANIAYVLIKLKLIVDCYL